MCAPNWGTFYHPLDCWEARWKKMKNPTSELTAPTKCSSWTVRRVVFRCRTTHARFTSTHFTIRISLKSKRNMWNRCRNESCFEFISITIIRIRNTMTRISIPLWATVSGLSDWPNLPIWNKLIIHTCTPFKEAKHKCQESVRACVRVRVCVCVTVPTYTFSF